MKINKSNQRDLDQLESNISLVIGKAGQFYRDSPKDETLYSVAPEMLEILTFAILDIALPILLNIGTSLIMKIFEKAKKKKEAYLRSLDKEKVKTDVKTMLDNILPGNTIEQDCKEKAINAVHDLLTYHGLMTRKADIYAQEIVNGIEKIISGDENENS
jgi:ribosomal protein S13